LIIAALLALTVFQNAASLLTYIPKLILGALLVFVGLSMLFDWVYQAWFRFPKSEFLIIMVILLVVAVQGFLEAIALGLVLAVVLLWSTTAGSAWSSKSSVGPSTAAG